MGTLDKVARILVAIIIAILDTTHVISGITATVLLIIASILIITSFVNFCPLYIPFDISTRKKEK
jgi:uncharacterized membrane protein YesL